MVDIAARTNAYLSGEVHFIDRADLKTIDLLKNAPETELYNVSGFAHYTAPMHCDAAPFSDVERAPGHQARHQPPGAGRQDPLRLRHARQRQSDLARR